MNKLIRALLIRITDLERQLSDACQQRDRAISNHMGAVEELAEARKAIVEADEIMQLGEKLDAMRVAEIEGMRPVLDDSNRRIIAGRQRR